MRWKPFVNPKTFRQIIRRCMPKNFQRRRRGIFVESQAKPNSSPVGAAYSDDVAPERSFGVRNRPDYKDFAPTVLTGEQRRRLDFSIFGCFHPNLLVFSLFR
jgi:hypothetical protein